MADHGYRAQQILAYYYPGVVFATLPRARDPLSAPPGVSLSWAEFERVDMRVGVVVDAQEFPEARRPASSSGSTSGRSASSAPAPRSPITTRRPRWSAAGWSRS